MIDRRHLVGQTAAGSLRYGASHPAMVDPRDESPLPPIDSVGVEELDRQHRVILARWRLLRRAADAGHAAGIRSNLWFLRRYFAEHFTAEEQLMTEAGYPGVRRHERAHAELLSRLESLQASHVEGGDRWGRGDFHCVLLWVTGHLAEHDAAMGRFLAARRRVQADRDREASP